MNILTPIVGAIFGVLFTGTIIVIKHLYVIESELRKIQRNQRRGGRMSDLTNEELKEVREALTTDEGYAAGCRCKYCKAVDAVLPLIDAEMDRCKINQKYANTYKHIADAFAYMLPLYLDMANEYQKAVALDVLSYLKIGKREEYSDEDEWEEE